MASCFGSVCNVCYSCWCLCRCWWDTPQATVDTIYVVNKLVRKATVWAKTPLDVHAHCSLVVVTYTDAGWTTRSDGTSQGGQLTGLHRKRRDVARNSIKHVSRILASSGETQAAADLDNEAVCIRLSEIGAVAAAGISKLADGSETHSCSSTGGLSWCLRRFGSLFVLLSWLEGQKNLAWKRLLVAQGGMFRVKALHLGTVSVCFAWSSPLSRYCCCVDCNTGNLDICFFAILSETRS